MKRELKCRYCERWVSANQPLVVPNHVSPGWPVCPGSGKGPKAKRGF